MTQSLKWFLLLQFVNRVDKLRTLKKKDQHKNEETKEENSKQQYTEKSEGG